MRRAGPAAGRLRTRPLAVETGPRLGRSALLALGALVALLAFAGAAPRSGSLAYPHHPPVHHAGVSAAQGAQYAPRFEVHGVAPAGVPSAVAIGQADSPPATPAAATRPSTPTAARGPPGRSS